MDDGWVPLQTEQINELVYRFLPHQAICFHASSLDYRSPAYPDYPPVYTFHLLCWTMATRSQFSNFSIKILRQHTKHEWAIDMVGEIFMPRTDDGGDIMDNLFVIPDMIDVIQSWGHLDLMALGARLDAVTHST